MPQQNPPNFDRALQNFPEEEKRVMRELRPKLEAAAKNEQRKQGLVRTGNLMNKTSARIKRGRLQVGDATPYGGIYNFGGTVRQKTSGPKGHRTWKVRARPWITAEVAEPHVAAAEADLVDRMEELTR